MMMWRRDWRLVVMTALALKAICAYGQTGKAIDLPTSKQLLPPMPGSPQQLNSLPISMAVSPDKRYVVTVNAGFGTFESNYMQSLAVVDTQTGKIADFPDDRTQVRAKQTLYSGLAFSRDGKHIYASMGSEADPTGTQKDDTGSGVVVYGFSDGKVSKERMIKIPLQQLAPGRKTRLIDGAEGDKGIPFPAAIAVLRSAGAEKILVADNLSDDVLLMDPATGATLTRFDLAENDAVPSTYPVALSVSKDESRAFVALWNSSEIVELDLKKGTVGRKLPLLKPENAVAAGTHPCAFEMSADGRTLYVALANRDAVAAVNVEAGEFGVKGYFDTRLPHQSYFGAEPEALALSPDGSRLYVANAITDAVAVFDTKKLTPKTAKQGMIEPLGFVPTEWMPMSLSISGGKLYIATAKGKGTGPNNFPQRQPAGYSGPRLGASTYIGTLLHGSLAVLDMKTIDQDLPKWTDEVLESNRMKAAEEKIQFRGGRNPIKHVIYVIKENRTYDQVFGDLQQNGKPVGNGDASLTMYGSDITPNEHKLALQFGVLDNFYDSGEVSGDGHVWSTAGIGTDYLEKSWQQDYRGGQRTYDFEGVVAEGYPILQKIPDVNEPTSGYLWGNMARHNKTYYNFGEYISSTFCDVKKSGSSQEGPLLEGVHCQTPSIQPGEPLPAEWGGGINKWAWPIPRLAKNIATKPELVGHFAEEQPDFNLRVPDQIRTEVFLKHFRGWVADREAGKDTMPNFILMRCGNDHTAGTVPGGPSPKSLVADNDLAVGRLVEAVSHSPYWDDTAIFVLEDDAQAGADHVDAHRSTALVISKYSPKAPNGATFVDNRFYSTVSFVRTIETLLEVPPMNNNDAFSSLISSLFTGDGTQPAYSADCVNQDNGLIYTANPKTAVGAKESMKMDFRHADHADTQKLNVILWKDAMGDQPVPSMLTEHRKKLKKDDDDDN
jgi:DNA-binding beta-propeller fold protein YncE